MSLLLLLYNLLSEEGGSFVVSTAIVVKFPAYFPENCPPAEAIAEKCLLFRLCKKATLSEQDFISFYLINPQKHKDNINAYGLSVFKSFDDCVRAKSKSPNLRKKYKYVARGLNNSYRGKILHTPNGTNPNHYTWWLYEGVQPHTFFEICNEGGEVNE